MGFNPRAFQEGRAQQLEGRRSQERAADPIDERILQEKEATLTSLLKEAKIISQESDQLQVTQENVSFIQIRMEIWFPWGGKNKEDGLDDSDDNDIAAKLLFKHLVCAFEKRVY